MSILSMVSDSAAGIDKRVEQLLALYGSNHHFVASLKERRAVWSSQRFQLWLRRIEDHYGDIINNVLGSIEYVRVASIEVMDGLDHYGFDLTSDQERRLISAVFWFDPEIFPKRVASDGFDESVKSVYTVLTDDELISLVLSTDWDSLNHAGALAAAGQLASVSHLKELLRDGSTRSLSEGAL